MAYIILNDKKSTMINGLVISTLPPITKPAKRTIIDEIDGRDGNIIQEVGYSAYTKEFEIGLVNSWDIDEIIEYFNSEGTVTFSNEPDKYYNYKITDQIDFTKLGIFRTATIKMWVQPFKYSLLEGVLPLNIQQNLIKMPDSRTYLYGLTFNTSAKTGEVSITGTYTGDDLGNIVFDFAVSANLVDKGTYKFFIEDTINTYKTMCTVSLIDNLENRRRFGGKELPVIFREKKETSAVNTRQTKYNFVTATLTNLSYGKEIAVYFCPRLRSDEITYLEVRNNGNVDARPILSIHGNGEIQVYLNDFKILIIDLRNESSITIDTVKMNAYTNGILKNRLVQGDYDDLILKPGINNIKIEGDVTLVTIKNYSRWL